LRKTFEYSTHAFNRESPLSLDGDMTQNQFSGESFTSAFVLESAHHAVFAGVHRLHSAVDRIDAREDVP
jgi:hypothetical protein